MSVGVTVQTEGFAELEAQLKVLREKFNVKTGGLVYRALQAGANLVRDDAKLRAPATDPKQFTQVAVRLQAQYLATSDKGKQKKIQRAIARSLSLIRQNIRAYKVGANTPIAGGNPTVIVRVSNAGWGRFDNIFRRGRAPIRFNRPGSSPGYWWWVEFGTSRFPARPFLRPAFKAQADNALKAYKKALQDEIAAQWGNHFKRST